MVLRVVGADANEGEQGSQRFRRIGLFERATLPRLGVLMLDRHAGRETDESVFVAEMRPGFANRRRVLMSVKRFELVPQRSVLAAGIGRGRRERRGRFAADVRDA